MMAIADLSLLKHLEPIAGLSLGRIQELASLCSIEVVNKNIDPLRMDLANANQAVYLIKGDLSVHFSNNKKIKLSGGKNSAKYPVNSNPQLIDTIALTDIEILRIDMDLIEILMTWDQLSNAKTGSGQCNVDVEKVSRAKCTPEDWMNDTGVFSAFNLQSGIFSRLPPVNVEHMFKRMVRITVTAGQTIIQQGAEGDYYYLIQKGAALVTRVNENNEAVVVADLNEGSAFGDEALVSDHKRNATVTMKTDGELLRLSKNDFVELLKTPVIKQITMTEAKLKVSQGAVWADARLPSEYNYDHIEGAINLPLNEIRQLASKLDKTKEYILYCQTGRRSAAAVFLLTEYGINAKLLSGGTQIENEYY